MRFLIEQSTIPYTHNHVIQDFCTFACGRLGFPEPPPMVFVDSTGAASFGSYRPATGDITVATGDRHIADVLRTLAHELVHHTQMLEGSPLDLDGLEYEANAVAGMLMREYNREHPELYGAEASPVEGLDSESESGSSFGQGVPTNPPYPTEVAEALTPLQELSNKTLASYKRAAKSELRSTNDGTYGKKYFNREYFRGQDLRAIRKKGIARATETLRKRYAVQEEAPVNSAGSGSVAGLGVGAQGEPGIQKTTKTPMFKRKPFKQFRDQLKESPWQTL